MSLEGVLKFVEAKQAGKRSASRLSGAQGEEASRKLFSVLHDAYKPQTEHPVEPCSYCGRKGHGKRAQRRVRSQQCPAYDHTCKHCAREHHFDNMCRSKDKSNSSESQNEQHEGAIFDTLCAATSSEQHTQCNLLLDHHLYNQIAKHLVINLINVK